MWLFVFIGIFCYLPTYPCEVFLDKQEKKRHIPKKLLSAIARVESGRRIDKKIKPWPWSINVEGKSFFFRTKKEAIRAVKRYQKKGIRNIDVGCMQINLKAHPRAFPNLTKAFTPKHNVAYGAWFLKREKEHCKTWKKAVGSFHSHTPSLAQPYQEKVWKEWKKLKKPQLSQKSKSSRKIRPQRIQKAFR